jgi:hypothetical protein
MWRFFPNSDDFLQGHEQVIQDGEHNLQGGYSLMFNEIDVERLLDWQADSVRL